jgi:hypothetical protein
MRGDALFGGLAEPCALARLLVAHLLFPGNVEGEGHPMWGVEGEGEQSPVSLFQMHVARTGICALKRTTIVDTF